MCILGMNKTNTYTHFVSQMLMTPIGDKRIEEPFLLFFIFCSCESKFGAGLFLIRNRFSTDQAEPELSTATKSVMRSAAQQAERYNPLTSASIVLTMNTHRLGRLRRKPCRNRKYISPVILGLGLRSLSYMQAKRIWAVLREEILSL